MKKPLPVRVEETTLKALKEQAQERKKSLSNHVDHVLTKHVAKPENKQIGNISINNTGDPGFSVSNCSLSFELKHNLAASRIFFNNNPSNNFVTVYYPSAVDARTLLRGNARRWF
mgnify:CR=1 FL=1